MDENLVVSPSTTTITYIKKFGPLFSMRHNVWNLILLSLMILDDLCNLSSNFGAPLCAVCRSSAQISATDTSQRSAAPTLIRAKPRLGQSALWTKSSYFSCKRKMLATPSFQSVPMDDSQDGWWLQPYAFHKQFHSQRFDTGQSQKSASPFVVVPLTWMT